MLTEWFWLSPFLDSSDPEPILREAFPEWRTGGGIFAAIESLGHELPWAGATGVNSTVLDIAYFGNHSGGKFCAPIVKLMLDENGVVPLASRQAIAQILVAKYLNNWNHLWATNTAVYNPIHNYDMEETRDLTTTGEEVEDTDDTHTGTNSTQYGRTEQTAHGRTQTDMSYKYGLNTETASPKPSDKVDTTEGGATTVTDGGTDTNTRNLADTRDRTTTNEGTEHEVTRRAGNIGVTTTQKMIQDDRELWLWNYFDQIFSDLDQELALLFHDSCRV